MNYQELEKIAEQSQNEKGTCDSDIDIHGEIRMFEMSLGVKISDRISYLRERFPNEPILVADIGGGSGGLAGEINRYSGVKTFVIDNCQRIPKKSTLPKNRFIILDAENMPEIPDNTFHYLVSFNAMTYMDISKSVPEAYRILRSDGLADLDWEFPNKDQLVELSKDNVFKYISINPAGLMTTLIHIKKPSQF